MRRTTQSIPLLILFSTFASPLSAQTVFGRNLVVNGDAETGAGTADGTPATSIPGWTISGAPSVLLYSNAGRLSNSNLGPANRGKNYFAGTTTAQASITQKIDLTAAASGIDAGNVSFDASGYVGGSEGDNSQMVVTLQSASGATTLTFTLGPLSSTDQGAAGLYLRRKIGQVPAGTRSAVIEVDMIRSSGSNNDGCADNISFLLTTGASVPSGFYGSNLIQNGNAEAPNGVDLLGIGQYTGFALDIPNWVRSAYFSLDTYTENGDLLPTDPGPSDRGSWYFYGGPGNSASNAYQDIDVSGASVDIDSGKVTFAFTGWVGGIAGQNDNMTVTAQFENWQGSVLATSTIGPVINADRNNMDALLYRSQSGAVPSGTRIVRVTMSSQRTDGSDDDGLADSLSLVFTAPGAGGVAPSIKSGGVVSASAFGGFSTVAPGSWVEIYGANLAGSTRQWAGGDFTGSSAPISLDNTSVSIGGQSAFVSYISPGQVNAQLPSGIATGTQQLTVTTPNGTSAQYPVTVNATQPGLLAPSSFIVAGNQYVAALHADGSFVLPPNAIPGLSTTQAKPGETILLYGVGFGNVTPSISAGQIVGVSNQLAQPFAIQFAQAGATVSYAGLAPGFVGLYQFNVVVPSVSDNDLTPLAFTLGGAAGSQHLYIAIHH